MSIFSMARHCFYIVPLAEPDSASVWSIFPDFTTFFTGDDPTFICRVVVAV
jgi:hypothetical protein